MHPADMPMSIALDPQVLPWIVVLFTFTIMAWIALRLIGALDRALERQSPPAPLRPVPAPPSPPQPAPAPAPVPVPHPPAPQPKPPAPADPFASAPPWFQWALHEIGSAEIGSTNDGPAIARYRSLAKCGNPGDPWCAIFANAALESSGVPGTKSPSSQSFRSDVDFVPISAPALGAIVVFWRNSPTSGEGHVGFYRGELGDRIWTLGGNENNMVQIEALPKSAGNFGLIGYWWPKSVPLPTGGAVIMPQGSPTHVQTPPGTPAAPVTPVPTFTMTGITATVFGGAGDPQKSAYTGQPVDPSKPGCALPFRFDTITPEVVVTNPATGKSVTCQVVDVGPWNTNDPYWSKGTRPQAETGTDTTGRHTNGAGIDITPAAAAAIGIDGKGLVNWQFAAT